MLTLRKPERMRTARRGMAAFELLLLMPVFLLLIGGMVGLADLLIAEQKLDEAAGRAGRVIAMGGSKEQALEAAAAVLGSERAKHAKITITPLGKHAATKRPARSMSMVASLLPPPEEPPEPTCRHLGLIEVRIEIDVCHATATRLVPLCRNEKLIGRTVVQRH